MITISKRLLLIAAAVVLIQDVGRLRAEGLRLPTVPSTVGELAGVDSDQWQRQLKEILSKQWIDVESRRGDTVDQIMTKAQKMFSVHRDGRRGLKSLWQLRTELGTRALTSQSQARAVAYLQLTSAWIEFMGRLQFEIREETKNMLRRIPRSEVRRLVILANDDGVGCVIPAVAFVLVTPPPSSKAVPFDSETRQSVLQLVHSTRDVDASRSLEQLLRWPHTPPELTLKIVHALDAIGCIATAADDESDLNCYTLYRKVGAIKESSLAVSGRMLRAELLQSLQKRISNRQHRHASRWGSVVLQPGDWVLQRNPSPYNRFTNLSPGLFTHVGIVADQIDRDGKHSTVIVDLPETGDQIDSAPASEFFRNSFHWIVLRHRDQDAAKRMGEVAAGLIGRTAQFDLTFNTSLVESQRGVLKRTDPVRTYCAGFLYLCGQEAGLSQSSLFPFRERPRSDRCDKNLRKIGLQLTEFVTPTGPIFSNNLEIVGSRLPLYSPSNLIKEAVYDEFALQLSDREFHKYETTAQRLRQQLADFSSGYSWVRQALAKANDVNPEIDLVAAARIATVIENLDAIANGLSEDYSNADRVIRSRRTPSGSDAQLLETIQQRPEDWYNRWRTGKISSRGLRQEMTDNYVQQGRQRVVSLFFDER